MALLSEHRPCGFKFRIAVSQRDPMRRTKRYFQIFAELLKTDEFRFKEWNLIPGRGAKFVKVGPSRHTGRDTNHHGVWVPTLPWMILNLGRLHREGPIIMQKIDKYLRYKFALGRLTQLILIDLFCFKVIF